MKFLFSILLFLLSTTLFAQDTTKISLNAAVIQVFGSGGISLSLKYDRILVNKPGFKIAQSVGYTPAYDFQESPAWFTEGNFIFGKKKHHLETGLGLALIQLYRTSDFIPTRNEINPFFTLGYRIQDFSKKGITFSVRGHINENSIGNLEGLWFGTTLGYSF
jgi:hypothetical protein